MLLTITATGDHASALGYLLHKHPERVQSFPVTLGTAHVFYPVSEPAEVTAALLVELDPVALVRSPAAGGFALGQYVNDRPYASSSLLSGALVQVFRSALNGRCSARPEFVDLELPLTLRLPALTVRGPAELIDRFFGPLGWQVTRSSVPLDPSVPAWGDSRYQDTTLNGTMRLTDALSHLYVLLPVLDGSKHYWVGPDEVDKLIRTAAGWLGTHPERDLITRRYLAHRRHLVRQAHDQLDAAELLEQLDEVPAPDDTDVTDCADQNEADQNEAGEPTAVTEPLRIQRRDEVIAQLKHHDCHTVVDLGCGTGALLRELIRDPSFTSLLGVDVSARDLERAAALLRLDRMGERQRDRIRLRQSSLTYVDPEIAGFDAAVLMEVIEHLDPDRLPTLGHTVFGTARPRVVLVTTPNAEHNVRYEGLAAGAFRHPDHRFEWTRAQFRAWAETTAASHGYTVEFVPVGQDDLEVGPPTQLAVFTLSETTPAAGAEVTR